MHELKKYMLIAFLNKFKQLGCNTIDDIINFLNEEIDEPDGLVFTWKSVK